MCNKHNLTAKSCATKGYIVYASIRDIDGYNAEKVKKKINKLAASVVELKIPIRIKNINVVELDVTDDKGVIDLVAEIIHV